MKMEAMKKVYAEVILNTSKEAAARVMLSERKSLQFQHELICLREDYARMMLRLNNHFKSQMQEAEARSLNQQKKIDELEAQLGEAEGIIVDLRDEIKQLHEKLETMTKNEYISKRKEHVHECLPENNALGSSITSRVSDVKAALVGITSLHPTALNYKSADVTDSYKFPGIMQYTEANLCRNGYSQRIRAFESNSSMVKLPTLEASDPQSVVNILAETSEAKSRENRLVQCVEKPYSVFRLKTNEKNPNSISCNKNQIIGTPRRSAGKNSLRSKSRKKYVKSWNLPLLGQLKACSSRLNVQSVENPTEALETLLENNMGLKECQRTPRRSGEKNARYREAITSLRGTPRKNYVKSKKLPLLGQLKACSSRLNAQSVENPTEALETLLENNTGLKECHRTHRRSAEKNARYREAITSLRGKPRKNYVKSWKLPLLGQLKAHSSRLNIVQSVENPTEALQTPLVNNTGCATEPDDLRNDVVKKCKDLRSDGERKKMVCGERGDEAEARENLRKKIRLTADDGLMGSELFDVPITEGFGSFREQVENVMSQKYEFSQKCRKNVLRKVDENVVPEKGPEERKMEKLTDISVVESNGVNDEMNGELEMVDG
ncbi:hypothetical protein RND81_10G076200 [Saponaria officinalis]